MKDPYERLRLDLEAAITLLADLERKVLDNMRPSDQSPFSPPPEQAAQLEQLHAAQYAPQLPGTVVEPPADRPALAESAMVQLAMGTAVSAGYIPPLLYAPLQAFIQKVRPGWAVGTCISAALLFALIASGQLPGSDAIRQPIIDLFRKLSATCPVPATVPALQVPPSLPVETPTPTDR